MRIAIFLFACGVFFCQMLASLPPAPWPLVGWVAGALAVLASLRVRRRHRHYARRVWWLVAAPMGFCFAAWHGQMQLRDVLPHASEGRDIAVRGVVASLPQRYGAGVRFEFDIEQAETDAPRRVWLSWYGGGGDEDEAALSPVHVGERWQLVVRLKRPRGNMNPHGFDYEAYLFERGVRATGYVRAGSRNTRLDDFVLTPETAVERLRETVRTRLQRVLGDAEYAGVIVALVVGDQRAVEQEFWSVFNRTGITHLMAISGFHITMVAALVGAIVGWCWRRNVWLAERLAAQKAALLAGWLAAFGYCLIAGMGVPAQRTLCMLTIAALSLFFNMRMSASRTLFVSLGVVLLLDPMAVTSAGFWLSFGAVAVLMFACSGGLGSGHWLWQAAKSQWAVTIGLIPALLAIFGQFSLVSPLANALAIPVVSFVVTPLALLGAFLPIDVSLVASHQVLAWMMVPMEYLADLPWAVWASHAPAVWTLLLALGGVMLFLLPRGMPMRFAGAFMLLPLVLVFPSRAGEGGARVTVLDVGQGLSIHIQTARHDLLFDTGPQFSAEANSGNRVIVPYLRSLGVRKLDAMVISHEDRDHSGGVHSVAEALPVVRVVDSLPAESLWRPAGVPHAPCRAGERWEWDGVVFEMLNPHEGQSGARNDASCVLMVTARGKRLLIPADIEAGAEAALVQRMGAGLKADVLIAPHHGSRTSSTPEFLAAVAPEMVIFPVGYRNRYRHPNKEVYRRYVATGASLLRTDRDGAVSFTLGEGAAPALSREVRRRYWHDQWAGGGAG